MAEEHVERFSIDSAVRGFHVYKHLHDPYAVSVVREDNVMVGHVPRTISALSYFFLRRNGMIICQVTGRRRRSVDSPQGGMEVPCTLTFVGQSQYIKKVQKLIALEPAKSIEHTSTTPFNNIQINTHPCHEGIYINFR